MLCRDDRPSLSRVEVEGKERGRGLGDFLRYLHPEVWVWADASATSGVVLFESNLNSTDC